MHLILTYSGWILSVYMLVLLHFATFPLEANPIKAAPAWIIATPLHPVDVGEDHRVDVLKDATFMYKRHSESSSSWRGPTCRHRVAYLCLPLGRKGCCCFTAVWFSLCEWKQEEANEQRSGIIRQELSPCNRDDRQEKLVEVTLDAAVQNNYISNRCYRVFGQ